MPSALILGGKVAPCTPGREGEAELVSVSSSFRLVLLLPASSPEHP